MMLQDKILAEYKSVVGMDYKDMLNLYIHPCSKNLKLGRPKLKKNLKILKKKKSELNDDDLYEMLDVIKNKYNFKEKKK